LLPQKAIFWPAEKILFLADLHLGKVNHFRRAGIPVPTLANRRNLEGIVDLVNLTRPERLLCLGDLFHSHYNPEWESFGELIKHFRATSFELVIGNHDIMSDQQYSRKGIKVHQQLRVGPFLLTHHPLEDSSGKPGAGGTPVYYNLAGHLHPGVTLRGSGRQAVTLPCFYFGQHAGLLPAFGAFTGLARIKPRKEDKVYVIADEKIIPVEV
jgi:DNA ligase-associated metallophosphoesterase